MEEKDERQQPGRRLNNQYVGRREAAARKRRQRARRRRLIILVIALLIAAGVAGGYWWFFIRENTPGKAQTQEDATVQLTDSMLTAIYERLDNLEDGQEAEEQADLTEQVQTLIEEWMSEHPDNVALDTTLTDSGVAADAQAVGEALANLEANTDGIVQSMNFNSTVITVSHRGYNAVAPENTLPAYVLARQMGYEYAECDVSFTADGIAVLLHDNSVDRTSNGTGNINELTFEQVRGLDFGSWKSDTYAGTLIPTFEEFIVLCHNIGLQPYIELKTGGGYSQENINALVKIVHDNGMDGKVSWISANVNYLRQVINADPSARICVVADTTTDAGASALVSTMQGLQNGSNEVVADLALVNLTDIRLQYFIDAGIPVEAYYISTDSNAVRAAVLAASTYISGFTLDVENAGEILYNAYVQ